MKLMIATDLHGSSYYTRKLLESYEKEQPGKLILLGDILYHGPRNDLPKDYAPKEVIAMLNPLANKILCVRGNCEAEVDQMVLDFPMLGDYATLPLGQRLVYATHGHHFGEETPPPLCPGDILLCGHTHVPKCADHGAYTYLNPGSVSIPKEGSAHSYMLLEDQTFTWKSVEDGASYRTWQA